MYQQILTAAIGILPMWCAAQVRTPGAYEELGTDLYLRHVQMLPLSHVTSDEPPPYAYTDLFAASAPGLLNPGETLSLGLSTWRAFGVTGATVSVWMDWNGDGSFAGNELLGELALSNGINYQNMDVAVPAGTSPGVKRMRVRAALAVGPWTPVRTTP